MSTDPKLAGKPRRILLVEDSENDAFLIERHLRRCGFQPSIHRVETAEAMSEALLGGSDPEQGGWDAILADYHLPSFSAPEALNLLKESCVDLPFIVLSGAVSEETAVMAMRAGAHDYVSKQNLARLVPAIEREIGEARARREKRRAEEALRSSERRFQHLMEAAPLGLLIGDAAGALLYANGAAEQLLDCPLPYRAGERPLGGHATGKAGPEWPTPISLLRQTARAWSAPGSDAPAPFETLCQTAQGVSVPLLVCSTVLNPEAEPSQWQMAVFLVDLTEQRRSQEAVRRTEKLAATGKLAASIAHEINNPLEAVTNCLYLLQQTELHPGARRYLEMAQRELNRVIHITTQTLRFYRQHTRPVETDVHELLETVLALYEARMRELGIEVSRQFSGIPCITAYDGEVRQIFSNLIGNAIDAMQADGGLLTVRTTLGRDGRTGRPGIRVTVADTGPGMDRGTMNRIFEPFFSTKGSTGAGLGLWVSQEIVAKHQGEIRVRTRRARAEGRPSGAARAPGAKSSPPGWTVFRLFLPCFPEFEVELPRSASETPAARSPEEAPAPDANLTSQGAA